MAARCALLFAAALAARSAAAPPLPPLHVALEAAARAAAAACGAASDICAFASAVAVEYDGADGTAFAVLPSGAAAGAAHPASAAWALADALTATRAHARAAEARALALAAAPPAAARGDALGGGSRAAALAALAHDLRHASLYSRARAALGAAGAAPGGAALAPVLARFDAELLGCEGRAVDALRRFAGARNASAGGAARAGDAALELAILRRAEAAAPPALRAPLAARAAALRAAAVARGPWRRADQLPEAFDAAAGGGARGAAPWHALDAAAAPPPRAVARAAAALRAAAPALRAEFAALRAAGALADETECIVEAPARADAWRVFLPVGAWRRDGDADGCSRAAPAACAARAALARAGLRVARVSYSALAPRTRLAPHTGPSNAVHKLHVGVDVPRGGCATLTVGGEARAHQDGEVLWFDDSFEHYAANDCDSERVVFQVVFDVTADAWAALAD